MKNNTASRKFLLPALTALVGGATGFAIFLLTGQIIFLIAFVPIGTVLGFILADPDGRDKTPANQE